MYTINFLHCWQAKAFVQLSGGTNLVMVGEEAQQFFGPTI